MKATIIDGNELSKKKRLCIAQETKEFTQKHGRPPGLAVVLVGEDPASAIYVRNKKKACETAGIRSFDYQLDAATKREDLLALVQFSSFPCTKADGMGGAPKCLSAEAEGAPVEVLPILGSEGHHMRRADFSTWAGIGAAQLFAAYRISESTYADEFFPTGDFGVAFLLEDRSNAVVFQVTEQGIVRIDFLTLPALQSILAESEVIYGPIPISE